ncbi:HAD family phosphatase [Candidatus Saccharibacteria bacterium]|nr:HAD family phosphatase [Candidatus Saccharibacteria bacterium]
MKTLFFADFDYTMWMHGDPGQTERNKRAIQEYRKRGGKFALATGRSLMSLMEDFPDYREYLDFLMAYDGALTYVVTPRGEEEIFRINIPPREVTEITSIVRGTEGDYRRDMVYLCGMGEYRKIPSRRWGRMPGQLGINKIRIWCEDVEDCRQLTEALSERDYNGYSYYDIPPESNFDIGRLHWVSDQARSAIEVLPRDVNKGEIIRALQGRFFRDYRIVTAGDDVNDISMIKLFDGYVVGQKGKTKLAESLPEAKTAATLAEVLDEIKV